MKITKKAFIDAMTSNNTAFIGTTKRLYNSDEVYCCIADLLKPDVILKKRSCIARSKDLVFSGNSHLSLDNGNKNEFFKYEYSNAVVYVYCYTWHDDFNNEDYTKAMYYMIKGA